MALLSGLKLQPGHFVIWRPLWETVYDIKALDWSKVQIFLLCHHLVPVEPGPLLPESTTDCMIPISQPPHQKPTKNNGRKKKTPLIIIIIIKKTLLKDPLGHGQS